MMMPGKTAICALVLLTAATPAQRVDFAARAEVVSMARAIGPATAAAPGPKADRYVLIAYDDAAKEPIVHTIGVVVPGGALEPVAPPTVAVLRTSGQAPTAADVAYSDSAGMPLFIAGSGSQKGKLWEIARRDGKMMVRAIAPRETGWKPAE